MTVKLTYADVAVLLSVDFTTGRLTWLPRPREMFSNALSFHSWNARYAGNEAFTAVNPKGYKHGTIFDRPYYAHRVIWLLATGEWPEDDVDHINHDRADNRWVNLRSVTAAENMKNRPRQANNSSGVTGVYWDEARGKWAAHIRVGGKPKNLGRFGAFDEAVAVRKAAERSRRFHANHGRSV